MLVQTGPQEQAQPSSDSRNGAGINQGEGGQGVERVEKKVGIHAGLKRPDLRHCYRACLRLLRTHLRNHQEDERDTQSLRHRLATGNGKGGGAFQRCGAPGKATARL